LPLAGPSGQLPDDTGPDHDSILNKIDLPSRGAAAAHAPVWFDTQMAIAAVLQAGVPIEGPVAHTTLELMSVRHCTDNYWRHWY
jgi:hypothetical protein